MIELRQLDVLAYPPAVNIFLLVIALLVWKRKRLSYTLIVVSTITLLIFSLPITGDRLLRSLDTYPALAPDTLASVPAEAIVVLGGGIHPYASEYGSATLTYAVIERIRYAAFIHRQTGLPILVSEGRDPNYDVTGANVMAQVLSDDYGIDNVIIEDEAMSTWQNAEFSKKLLSEKSMNNIFLVTNSWHMARAVHIFGSFDFDIIPAPTLARPDVQRTPRHFIPDAGALESSRIALHEYLGLLWYKVKAQFTLP
jgi:uncharacterized SAM-binding protein YcdF (DUF218 family)